MVELVEGFAKDRLARYNSQNPDKQINLNGQQARPVGKYGYFHRDKTTITFSGFGSRYFNIDPINGIITADDAGLEHGKSAARGAALNFLNNLVVATNGDLDGVRHVSIQVFQACVPEFKKHPFVADAASEVLIAALGNFAGIPQRTAFGNTSLPNDMTVEINGSVVITKALAKKLDLLEAKKLDQVLSEVSTLLKPLAEYKNVIKKDDLELTKKHRKKFGEKCNDLIQSLLEQKNVKQINSKIGENEVLKGLGIKSISDLVDCVRFHAQNINVEVIYPAKKVMLAHGISTPALQKKAELSPT